MPVGRRCGELPNGSGHLKCRFYGIQGDREASEVSIVGSKDEFAGVEYHPIPPTKVDILHSVPEGVFDSLFP